MKMLSFLALILVGSTLAFAQKVENNPEPFFMQIEDVFPVAGVGIVARGTIERGKIKVGDEVDLVGIKPVKTTTVAGIIKPPIREVQTEAGKGDTVGIVLKGVTKDDLSRGQVIAKPGSLKAASKFKATLDMVSALGGGRRTPFATGYRPQVFIRLGMFTGVVTLPAGVETVEPGAKGVEVEIELNSPAALEKGTAFELREGGRVVGKGTVLSLEIPEQNVTSARLGQPGGQLKC
jgi:elongation factor Tu